MEHPQARELKLYRDSLALGRWLCLTLLTLWLFYENVPGNGKALSYSAQLTLTVEHPWLRIFTYCAVLGILYYTVWAPFIFLSSYAVNHKFGLNHQSMDEWFLDHFKELFVFILMAAAALSGVLICIVVSAEHWWIWAASGYTLASIIVVRLMPHVIIPLFYKMTPVTNQQILQRILSITQKEKLKLMGIFQINLSRKTHAANAAVVGWGSSRRAVISDTMLNKFSSEEVNFVLCHELAHHHYGDIWTGLGISCLAAFLSFYLTHILVKYLSADFGLAFPTSDLQLIHPVIMYWIFLLFFVIQLFWTPFFCWASRHMERRADAFAARVTGNPESGIAAFERLGYLNKSTFHLPKWQEFLFATHPSLHNRIRRLKSSLITHAHT